MHAPTAELPVVPTYVSIGHFVHSECPSVFLNLPALHALHFSPSLFGTDEVNPAQHLQSSCEVLPRGDCVDCAQFWQSVSIVRAFTVEYVSNGQSVQFPDPLLGLNLPAAHGRHVAPSKPVKPGLHLQSVSFPLPGLAVALSGHGSHCENPSPENPPGHVRHDSKFVAVETTEYLPEVHFEHASMFNWLLYVPAAQGMQDAFCVPRSLV